MSLPTSVNVPLPPAIEAQVQQLRLHQNSARRVLQPVAIIGPGDGGVRECEAARQVATLLARSGFAVICGGRHGVMQAASQGATEAGGLAIGLLPDDDARSANPYLSVAIPTGMGEARNALIARASLGLIAIGGGLGTISEMALGLKIGKPVFSLYEDVQLEGQHRMPSLGHLLIAVSHWLTAHVEGIDPDLK
jgi:uncharacterized protein (TIGR00725 family)